MIPSQCCLRNFWRNRLALSRCVEFSSSFRNGERLSAKMRDPSNQQKYDQRMRIAETPFGLIKEVLGLRQFLLRGLEKVQTEWRWACLAVNLDKLVRGIQRLREEFQEVATSKA